MTEQRNKARAMFLPKWTTFDGAISRYIKKLKNKNLVNFLVIQRLEFHQVKFHYQGIHSFGDKKQKIVNQFQLPGGKLIPEIR